MTYEDLRNVLKQQLPQEVLELCNLMDVEDLVFALSDYVESHQDEIKVELEENGLV